VKAVVLRGVGGQAEVLLVRRADNGRWTVPAGILEPGEEPADGITREVLEETGVTATVTRLVGVQTTQPTTYPNGDRAQYLDVIMALDPSPDSAEARVNDDENLEVAWRDVTDLGDVPPLHVRAVRWAMDQDPRFTPGAEAGGRFMADGRERH
jgi:8-oxo-dGTP pyrophosphatase MutT (NUDIX family)